MSQREVSGRPDLDQYRKQAKELVRAQRLGLTSALERVRRHHSRFHALAQEEIQTVEFSLADSQLVIARELSFESWPKLVKFIATIRLIESVAALADPISAFIEVACVPWHAGIGTERWNMRR